MPASGKRSEAKKAGYVEYFTGVPCKNGHVANRRVSDGSCLECKRNGRPSGLIKFKCQPRPPISCGDHATVDLGNGSLAVIDIDDIALVAPFNWYRLQTKPGRFYAATNAKRDGRWRCVLMHCLITGSPMTDHRDGNGLNNRRHNVRACTTSQNGANRGAQRNSQTGIKGVIRFRNKFRAGIMVNKRSIHLGVFDSARDAAAAYASAAEKYFGEFARTT